MRMAVDWILLVEGAKAVAPEIAETARAIESFMFQVVIGI